MEKAEKNDGGGGKRNLDGQIARARKATGMTPLPMFWSTNETAPPVFDLPAYERAIREATLTAVEAGAPTPTSTAMEDVLDSLPPLVEAQKKDQDAGQETEDEEEEDDDEMPANSSSGTFKEKRKTTDEEAPGGDTYDELEKGKLKSQLSFMDRKMLVRKHMHRCRKRCYRWFRMLQYTLGVVLLPNLVKEAVETFVVVTIVMCVLTPKYESGRTTAGRTLRPKHALTVLGRLFLGVALGKVFGKVFRLVSYAFSHMGRLLGTVAFVVDCFEYVALEAISISAGILAWPRIFASVNFKLETAEKVEQRLDDVIVNVLVLAISFGAQRTAIRWVLSLWTAEKFRSRVEETKPKRHIVRALAALAADEQERLDNLVKMQHVLAAGATIALALQQKKQQMHQNIHDDHMKDAEAKVDSDLTAENLKLPVPTSPKDQYKSFFRLRRTAKKGEDILVPPKGNTTIEQAGEFLAPYADPDGVASRPSSSALPPVRAIIKEEELNDRGLGGPPSESDESQRDLWTLGQVGSFKRASRKLRVAIDLGVLFGTMGTTTQSRKAAKRIFRLLHYTSKNENQEARLQEAMYRRAMARSGSSSENLPGVNIPPQTLSPAHSFAGTPGSVATGVHSHGASTVLPSKASTMRHLAMMRDKRAAIDRETLKMMLFTPSDLDVARRYEDRNRKDRLWGRTLDDAKKQSKKRLLQKRMRDNVDAFDSLFPPSTTHVRELDFVDVMLGVVNERRFLSATIDSQSGVNKLMERMVAVAWAIVMTLVTLSYWEVPLLDWIVALASIFIALSVAFGSTASNFVVGVCFVIFSAPYDIGDRIMVARHEQQTYFILPLTVFQIGPVTTLFKSVWGETLTMHNAELAKLVVVNHSRSPNPFMQVNLFLSTETPAKRVKQFTGGIRHYVNSHPDEWIAANIFFVELRTQDNALILDCWFGSTFHYHNWNALFQSRSKLLSFIHVYGQAMGLKFVKPVYPLNVSNSSSNNNPSRGGGTAGPFGTQPRSNPPLPPTTSSEQQHPDNSRFPTVV